MTFDRPAGGGDESAGSGDPIHAGHAYVHDDDIWSGPVGDCQRLLARSRFRDHVDVGLGVQDEAQALPDECLVIG